MANLNITNKEKPPIKLKCFNAVESSLCASTFSKASQITLCHNGTAPYPNNGDTIYYKKDGSYIPYTNNTAYIPYIYYISSSLENEVTFLKTDSDGVCEIIICNNKWHILQ